MNGLMNWNKIQAAALATAVRQWLASAQAENIPQISAVTGLILAFLLVLPVLFLSWRREKSLLGRRTGRTEGRLSRLLFSLLAVLPPAFVGILLAGLWGADGLTGRALVHAVGWQGIYPWLGALTASVLAAVPVWYLAFAHALERTDSSVLSAAGTLGIRKRKIFWNIVMPQAVCGVVQGTVLGFSRAAGEYGACALLACALLKTEASGRRAAGGIFGIPGSALLAAWGWDLLCLAVGCVLCLLIAGFFSIRRKRRNRRPWSEGSKKSA